MRNRRQGPHPLRSRSPTPQGRPDVRGLGLGQPTHAVTVLDDAGVVVDRWAFKHTEQDLVGALERLARLAEPAALPVIIERASGLVVERLLAAGHPVVPVHPTAFRPPAPLGRVGGEVRSRRQLQAR